ncbi:Holliday junction resolvase RecU [Desertibacillus haloalkaliphilus]|uniref:Holliday junction resolvase RecU n=1 Tax=Desertibacillus haloalkaliphilus TaxID=1328930 RepID=UPI001FEA89C8|nr:Holliday junction resolvase RecU [Desertibacillus haloalkaliphilus]
MAINYANRGKHLEVLVDHSNVQYKRKGWARIDKVPTPVKVRRQNKLGRITDGWFEKKSTVDYAGISHGRSIVFDAKSTKIDKRFDLKNLEEHQYQYLKDCHHQGAISFVLVEFSRKKEIYILPFEKLEIWWISAQGGGRKSIPYEFFLTECDLVSQGRGVPLDYLKVVM